MTFIVVWENAKGDSGTPVQFPTYEAAEAYVLDSFAEAQERDGATACEIRQDGNVLRRVTNANGT